LRFFFKSPAQNDDIFKAEVWVMSVEQHQQQANGEGSSMEGYDTGGGGGRNGSNVVQQPNVAGAAVAPMIGNINSPSVSLASVSSDGSTESYVVEPEEMFALTQV
jgi:hypothetical protein